VNPVSSGRIAVELHDVGKRFKRAPDRRGTLTERIVRGRSKRSEDFWALRHLTLAIPAGSLYGVVGHNGSGKSTLLKLIGNVSRPTEGSIAVEGRVAALIELGAGFHPDLSGRENIRLNGAVLGLHKREIAASMGDIIEFSGLSEFIDDPVKHYSSGMYVRLGFSVAAHMRPDVLLVDEVLAVGDEDFQRKCLDHLFNMRRAGRTIVVVSHGLGLLESLCDEVAWLDHGNLQQVGAPSDVIGAYMAQVNATAATNGRHASAVRPESEQRAGWRARTASLELRSGDGDPVGTLLTGDTARFRLAVECSEPVDDLVVRIVIQHEGGAVVGVLDSRLDQFVAGDVSDGAEFEVDLADTTLLPGRFRVHVELCDRAGTRVLDTWVDALELVIRAADGELAQGIVRLDGRFRRV
jgi:ABC-2 type transport system ATP-binding protein/lipopolysaccharide transport system ATP-binding protein